MSSDTHVALEQSARLRAAMDAIPSDTDAITRAKLRALLRGYEARYGNDDLYSVASESVYTMPLARVSGCRVVKSGTFTIAGKIDCIALNKSTGDTYLIDHKTTSYDITDPISPYLRQLGIDLQPMVYVMLLQYDCWLVTDVMWDIVRKPIITPRRLTHTERKVLQETGMYYGHPISQEAIQCVETEEVPELYEARLTYQCTVERPEWYFRRHYIRHTGIELERCLDDVWAISQSILTSRRYNRWPRNSGACLAYGVPCEFLSLCEGHSDIRHWQRTSHVHAELRELPNADSNVLTVSSLKCYLACAQKYQYRYELGLVHAEPIESEALYFGVLWHKVLAAWWPGKEKGDAQ